MRSPSFRLTPSGTDLSSPPPPLLRVDWRKLRPKMHLDGTGRDPAPDAEPFLRDIECEHGGLQPDPKKRHFITPAVRSSLPPLSSRY